MKRVPACGPTEHGSSPVEGKLLNTKSEWSVVAHARTHFAYSKQAWSEKKCSVRHV